MRLRPVLILAVAALLLAACSGDDDAETATTKPDRTTTTIAVGVALTRGEVAVASAGGDIALDEPTQQAAVDAAQQYVDIAMIAPLTTGEVGAGYDALFDGAVGANATGPDRAALTDDGLPRATGDTTVTATPVRVDALADKDGKVVLLGATFDVDVRAQSAKGPMSVHRSNELTYAPAEGGGWRITAYRVSVQRDTPTGATSTSAASTTAETTK